MNTKFSRDRFELKSSCRAKGMDGRMMMTFKTKTGDPDQLIPPGKALVKPRLEYQA